MLDSIVSQTGDVKCGGYFKVSAITETTSAIKSENKRFTQLETKITTYI